MTRKTLPVSLPIEGLRRRLDRWRRVRKHRARIPGNLWAAAVDVARECGVHKTARALGLDYYSLKERLEAAHSDGPPVEAPPSFFELIPTAAANSGRLSECTVEFDDGCGAKMKIHLKGAEAADLVALSRTFWGARE